MQASQAAVEQLRAGCRVCVTVDNVLNDTLVVSLVYREMRYTGILLDSRRTTGLFCLPDVVTKPEEYFAPKAAGGVPQAPSQNIASTPTQTPPTGSTPTQTPPTGSTPTQTPPTGSTPTQTPPTGSTPTQTPPTGSTPTQTPPTASTPTQTPPTASTPTQTPPTTSTPTQTPPTTSTPTQTPPTDSTPTQTPPTDSTPTQTPPTASTPTQTPPTASTPTQTPPTASTPTQTPPTTDCTLAEAPPPRTDSTPTQTSPHRGSTSTQAPPHYTVSAFTQATPTTNAPAAHSGPLPYPPYFEGAPFPPPLWLRHTYSQWVPQPPPRQIKRRKRRSREPGRLTESSIRLRPRQVLCEKCKNTVNNDEDRKQDEGRRTKRDRKEEEVEEEEEESFSKGNVVPHSPVIKISYSTPQGTGEVMEIPSRVHGSVKPFCPKQLLQNASGHVPKLKLSRPADTLSPKLCLRPRVYAAELVSPDTQDDLALLINLRKRKGDSSSVSVCSSDSLSSDTTEMCELAPGAPREQDPTRTVPPLTVRLHAHGGLTRCVTGEGQAVAVGDVVWGKIHGFPWWPARVLSLSASSGTAWPQAHVSWFGSPTTSQLSVDKLSPFPQSFRSRFNRRKKGMYRRAILEAAKAVGHVSPEITSLLQHNMDT